MNSQKPIDQDNPNQLVRKLNLKSAFFVSMGSVIGSGIFLVASDIAKAVPNAFVGLLVWLAAGAVSIAGALLFAELGTMFPKAGGQYVFLRESFSPNIAFLFGWTLILVIEAGSIAAVAAAFARFLGKFVPLEHIGLNLSATAIIVALTLFNFAGIKRGAQFLNAVTSFKVVALLGFIFLVFCFGPSGTATPIKVEWGDISLSAFGVALLSAFWAFDGWYNLTFVSEEVVDPEKNIPKASFAGVFTVLILYVLTSYAYFKVLTLEQIANSSFVAGDAAQIVGGTLGLTIMSLFVIVSVVGCLNTMILSGARVIYAMAKDKLFFSTLAVLNKDNHSPNRALLAQMVWSVLLVWSGSYNQLYTYVVFGAFVFYGLTAYAVIHLRKTKPDIVRPYRAPFYPVLPVLFVLFSFLFTLNSLFEKPVESLIGAGIILSGFPAFYYFRKKYSKGTN